MSKIHADMMRLLKQMENPFLPSIDLQLARMENLMSALGHPERKLPPAVHVAGTNGKGSLMAYVRAIYEAAGKSAHVYTSPHLMRFNERIVLAGKEVEDAELYDALRRVYMLHQQFPGTLFESVTAAAFLLFAKHQADVVLIEVGMGGRLDATNIIDKPAVSVITPVSIDHSEYLGRDVPTIAREKAGIMKKGIPCVIGPQREDGMAVLTAHALHVGTPVMRHGYEWSLYVEGEKRIYKSDTLTMELPHPALAGDHQWYNAATAVAVADVLMRQGIALTPEHVAAGIANAKWEGRLQPLTSPKWTEMLPPGSEVWLDGGHNPAAGHVLARWAKDHWGEKPQIHLICAMVKSKDTRGFMEPLSHLVRHLWAIPIHDEPNALMPGELEYKAQSMGIAAGTAHNVREALQKVGASVQGEGPTHVLIAGSLYMVGQVIAEGV